MNEIRFFVSGTPAPGGSKNVFGIKKAGVYTGRFVVTDAGGKRNKEWRKLVSMAGLEAMKQRGEYPWECAIELELIFHMPRPKSHFKGSSGVLKDSAVSQHIIIRPDVGKLARSTQDALTNICWRDDAQIVKETHEKFYSDQSGAWIVVREAGK